MGDEVRTDKPGLDVVVIGTGPLDRVEVLRDGEVVHTLKPEKNAAEAKFHWDDPAPRAATRRVITTCVCSKRMAAWPGRRRSG